MTEVGGVYAKIGADIADFKKKMDEVGRRLEGMERQAQQSTKGAGASFANIAKGTLVGGLAVQALTTSMRVAAQAAQTLASQIISVSKSAVGAAAAFEQTRIAFSTMLGSAAEADDFLKELERFAARTPFQFDELTAAAKMMKAFGYETQDVLPTLSAVGDAAAALGKSGEGINRIILAMGQMKAKGKVSGEEMRQLAEAGIPAWRYLADAIGTDIPTAMKRAETGGIEAGKAIKALVAGMTKDYQGMMKAQSTTLNGMISTMKDEIGFALKDIGNEILPGVKSALGGLLEWFDKMNKEGKIKEWAKASGAAIKEMMILIIESMTPIINAVSLMVQALIQAAILVQKYRRRDTTGVGGPNGDQLVVTDQAEYDRLTKSIENLEGGLKAVSEFSGDAATAIQNMKKSMVEAGSATSSQVTMLKEIRDRNKKEDDKERDRQKQVAQQNLNELKRQGEDTAKAVALNMKNRNQIVVRGDREMVEEFVKAGWSKAEAEAAALQYAQDQWRNQQTALSASEMASYEDRKKSKLSFYQTGARMQGKEHQREFAEEEARLERLREFIEREAALRQMKYEQGPARDIAKRQAEADAAAEARNLQAQEVMEGIGPSAAPSDYSVTLEMQQKVIEGMQEMAQVSYDASIEQNRSFWEVFLEQNTNSATAWRDMMVSTTEQVVQGFSDGIADMIVEGENFAMVMQNLLKHVLRSIISFLVQWTIAWIAASVKQSTASATANTIITTTNTAAGVSESAKQGAQKGGPWTAAAYIALFLGALLAGFAAGKKGSKKANQTGSAHAGLEYVPQDSTYVLKAGERVVAPKQNTDLTEFLAAQQEANRRPMRVVLQTPSGREMMSWLVDETENGRGSGRTRFLTQRG